MSGGMGPYSATMMIWMECGLRKSELVNSTLTMHHKELTNPTKIHHRSRNKKRNVIVRRPLDNLHQTRRDHLDVLFVRF